MRLTSMCAPGEGHQQKDVSPRLQDVTHESDEQEGMSLSPSRISSARHIRQAPFTDKENDRNVAFA